MANPVNIACPVGAWTIVASGVTNGNIIMKNSIAEYVITTRDTGGIAPTDPSEGRRAFIKCIQESISDTVGRDVYIYCFKEAGLVEVTI